MNTNHNCYLVDVEMIFYACLWVTMENVHNQLIAHPTSIATWASVRTLRKLVTPALTGMSVGALPPVSIMMLLPSQGCAHSICKLIVGLISMSLRK